MKIEKLHLSYQAFHNINLKNYVWFRHTESVALWRIWETWAFVSITGVQSGVVGNRLMRCRWYPAKRALSAMRKHGGQGPFGRIPSMYQCDSLISSINHYWLLLTTSGIRDSGIMKLNGCIQSVRTAYMGIKYKPPFQWLSWMEWMEWVNNWWEMITLSLYKVWVSERHWVNYRRTCLVYIHWYVCL